MPHFARATPWVWEEKFAAAIGAERGQAICIPPSRAAALERLLLKRLYPQSPEDKRFAVHIDLTRNDAVNAYSGLGGHITVNSGLLEQAESPDELAGVLAHEIEHVHRRHIVEATMSRLITTVGVALIFSGSSADWARFFLDIEYSRNQEAQADAGALVRLRRAQIGNRGYLNFFRRLERSGGTPEFLSDHPSDRSRIDMVERFRNGEVRPIMSPADWRYFRYICSVRSIQK